MYLSLWQELLSIHCGKQNESEVDTDYMNKNYILFLFILIFSINQEQIAFAETTNVQTEEQIDNNTSNETMLLPRVSNPLQNCSVELYFITQYEIILGQPFELSFPYIDGTDEYCRYIPFSKLKYSWKNSRPVDTSKLYDTGVIEYTYETPTFFKTQVVNVKVVEGDGRKAELKNTELYVGQKWDLGSVFKNVLDRDGNPVKPEQVKNVWINSLKKREIDTSKAGNYRVEIGVSSPKTKPLLYSNVAYVTVKEDQTKAELKDTELYVDQKWDLGSVLKNVVDKDGNPIKSEEIEWIWIDGKEKVREIDTSKPGKHIVSIAIRNAADRNYWVTSNTATVTVKEDQTKAELKDTELYVNQKWDLGSVFKNVVGKDGNQIKPEEVERVLVDGKDSVKEIDTSKPGKHTVQLAILSAYNEWVYSNIATVTVKEDKTKAELENTELYVGQKWNLGSVFKYAIDKDGNPINLEQVLWVEINGKWIDLRDNENKTKELIDTSKPGNHKVRIAVVNGSGNISNPWTKSNTATVTVKEDKTSIETKNSTLYVGQKWNPNDNFVNATDEDGKSITWKDPRITKNGASIDTSKPGEHKIKYTFKGKVKDVDSEFTVIVKEEPFTIKQVPYFEFADYNLVSTNKSVVNKKENPTIELETPSIIGKDWQLQVELSPFLDKENSKSILKGVSLFIPKGKLESDSETEEPAQYGCQLEANGKASILMHGTKTKGKGRWKNKLATKEITLSIPPENKKGNYESTLHWTLLDVPG